MTSFTDLPEDVVYNLLRSFPDFASLASMIKVSKKYTYSVFQEHKRVIVYAVAVNMMGSFLPHALNIFRRSEYEELIDVVSVDVLMDAIVCLSRVGRTHLEDIMETVTVLEALLSQTHKDRRSTESVLTSTESDRFRLAIYTVWDLCITGDQARDSDEYANEDADDVWFAERIKPALMQCDQSELSDFFLTAIFLRKVCAWAERATITLSTPQYVENTVPSDDASRFYSALSWPNTVTHHYLLKHISIWDKSESEIGWTALTYSVTSVSNAKNFGLDIAQMQAACNPCIDDIHGADDICFRCKAAYGVNLYGRINWHLVRDYAHLPYLCSGLNGNLPRNKTELEGIGAYFRRGWDDTPRKLFDWPRFVEETFDLANKEVLADGDEKWDEDQWYCRGCLGHLLRTRLRKWWIRKKREENLPFKPGCLYGYDCHPQQLNTDHAEEFDHLCEPSPGFGVPPPLASGYPPRSVFPAVRTSHSHLVLSESNHQDR